MKKFLSLLLSTAIVASTVVATGVTAYAAEDVTEYLVGSAGSTPRLEFIYSDTYMGEGTIEGDNLSQYFAVKSYDAGYIYKIEVTPGDSAPQILFDETGGSLNLSKSYNLTRGITAYKLDITYGPAFDNTTTSTVTLHYPALVQDSAGGDGGNGGGDNVPPDESNPPDNNGPTASLNVSASTTSATTKPVTLTCSVSNGSSEHKIKDPSGAKSAAGAASKSWVASENGSYTFYLLDGSDGVVTSKTYTVSNIDTRMPSVANITYGVATANTMTVTVDLGDFDPSLYRIDTSGLPSGYSANLTGNRLVVSMPNTSATFRVKSINNETGTTKDLSITTVKQGFSSGNLKFEDYTVLDWDEDDLDLRLNFSGMEGYTYQTKSLSSKYKAKVSGDNSIDIVCENKSQTLKLEFEDSEGKTKRVSVKIYKAPVVSKVEATDLTAKRTYFKFYFEGLSSSFFDLDEDQFDNDYKAKWNRNVLTLRLDTDDDTITMEFTDDYDNTYELDYDLEIDELLNEREVSVNSVSVVSKDDAARKATVDVSFNGVRDLVLDESDLWDYNVKKMDSSTYRLTIPYGNKSITFTFDDDEWDNTYNVKHQFHLNEDTTVGSTDYTDGSSSTSSGSGSSSGSSSTSSTNTSKTPQTGGPISGLELLLKSVA